MTVSFVAAGTAAYDNATSPLNVPYPATVAAQNKAILLVGQKPSTANGGTVATPTGWTLVAEITGAGGYGTTLGADTGNTNLRLYERDALTDGTEGGTNLSLAHATTNVLWAQIQLLESDTGTFDATAATTGSDTSAGSVSIAGAGALAFAPGDLVIGAMCIPTDVTTPAQFSAQAFTAASITFGTVTETAEYDSTTGNDIGGFSCRAAVSSGTATSTPTMTATAGGTTTNVRGPGIIARFRSGAAVPPTVTVDPADLTSILDDAAATFSVAATGTPTLTYQWEQNDGAGWGNVSGGSGGTTATYTAPASTAAMNGRQYRCVVTNGEGSDTSAAATWTVVPYRSLAGIQSTTNGTTYNGSSVTVGQNRLGVYHVVAMGFDTSDRAVPTNVRIGSHELTQVGTGVIVGPYTTHSKWVCQSTSGDITGTLQVVFNAADQQDNISVGGGEWEGLTTTGSNGADAIGTLAENSGTSASLSVTSIADPGSTGEWVMALWGWGDPASAANQTHTPGGTLVEASEGAAVDSGWYSATAIAVGPKAASVSGTLTASETYAGAATILIKAAAGTPTGRSDEADAALTLAGAQARATGRSDEADAALTLAGAQARATGRADETEASLALAAVQSAAVGVASETDASLPLGVARPAEVATETAAALALSAALAAPVGRADEADAAQALSGAQLRAAGRGDEADAALALPALQIAVTGTSSETDDALALAAAQLAAAGLAAETNAAQALAAARPAGRSDEADAALALAAVQQAAAGTAAEIDAALDLAANVGAAAGMATETDGGFALAAVQVAATGPADEIDSALARAARQIAAAGLAAESDEAQSLAAIQSSPAGFATETDAALDLAAGSTSSAGRADETDAALALVPLQLSAVSRADEADTALALSSAIKGPVEAATEANTAFALAAVQVAAVGLATENDSAPGPAAPVEPPVAPPAPATSGGSRVGSSAVITARSIEDAQRRARARRAPVGLAEEADVALALGGTQIDRRPAPVPAPSPAPTAPPMPAKASAADHAAAAAASRRVVIEAGNRALLSIAAAWLAHEAEEDAEEEAMTP